MTPAHPAAGPSIFLQPHFDDVALSCGATAAWLARQDVDCGIVTVFAGEVNEQDLDAFAARKHARWNVRSAAELMAMRRKEDAQAASALGCSLTWLDHSDAIYRDGLYGSDSRLYGLVNDRELDFAGALAQQVTRLPAFTQATAVYVPLGVGNHVDHQLVFEAGSVLADQGVLVYAYEDLPYSIHSPHLLAQRLDAVAGSLGSEIRRPVDQAFAQKLQAIGCYQSQLPVIFRFTPDWQASVRDHALKLGGSTLVERFWRVVV